MTTQTNNNQRKGLIMASLLVTLGTLLLLKNFDIFDFRLPVQIISWKLVPLFIGIRAFMKGDNAKGIFATSLAVLFYIPEFLNYELADAYFKLWPILLIATGVFLYYRRTNPNYRQISQNFEEDRFNRINESYLMAGAQKKMSSKDFEGGRVNCVMSGLDLDLTESNVEKNPILDVFVLMGGLKLILPKDWDVKLEVTPIMGGVEDQISKYPHDVVNPNKQFIIRGEVIMGGIEIKRF